MLNKLAIYIPWTALDMPDTYESHVIAEATVISLWLKDDSCIMEAVDGLLEEIIEERGEDVYDVENIRVSNLARDIYSTVSLTSKSIIEHFISNELSFSDSNFNRYGIIVKFDKDDLPTSHYAANRALLDDDDVPFY